MDNAAVVEGCEQVMDYISSNITFETIDSIYPVAESPQGYITFTYQEHYTYDGNTVVKQDPIIHLVSCVSNLLDAVSLI